MIEVTLKFQSTDAAQEFLTWFNGRKAPANPLPQPESVTPEPKKRGRPGKDVATPQATVGAVPSAVQADAGNGASVPSSAPTTAGAEGTEPEQLPLTGVDPAPVAQDVPQITHSSPPATESEMKAAAMAVIAKLGQVQGMNAAREVLERVAGVKLIRDVPDTKYGEVKAAMEKLTA